MQEYKLKCPINLNQFLKLAGLGTGGEIKILIQMGKIKVNDIVVHARNKKLFNEDIVKVENVGVFKVLEGK